MLLKDICWLWGHPEGCYNNAYGNNRVSRMTPMEACLYLGIRNTFMVPDGEHNGTTVNRRQYNKSFKTLRNVGWEFGSDILATNGNVGAIDAFISDANDFPNISCAVFDDFRSRIGEQISLEDYKKIHDKFHNNDVRPLDTWMVVYTINYGEDSEKDADFAKYMADFDGVIMWTWAEKDVPLIPEKFELLKKLAPNCRRMFGCYLWNFGESKAATGYAVKWQLDWYYEKILAGEAEGIVFHTNTMADLDLEAYDVAVKWMEEHGNDVLPDNLGF